MASQDYFLNQPQRFFAALNRFDPLRKELLLQWIDPIPSGRSLEKGEGGIPALRLVFACALLMVPEVIFSLSSSKTLGGNFLGEHGMGRDPMIWLQFGLLTSWVFLIVWIRRLLGDLVNELERSGVTNLSPDLEAMKEWATHRRWAVRRSVWLIQSRGHFWIILFVCINALQLPEKLRDSVHDWTTSPWNPGSFLSVLHIGERQVNWAGIWHFAVLSAAAGYLVILILRLYVAFSYICSRMAADPLLRIMPGHPDGTGGLLPLGKISLVLSLFTFTSGSWLTGLTFFLFGALHGTPTFMFYVLWIAYFVLGPVLFVLPIWPLRREMVKAKSNYLSSLELMYAKVEADHMSDVNNHCLREGALKLRADLVGLLDHAQGMAVWPFDRVTFRRFAGTLLAPLTPLALERMKPTFEQLLRFINGTS